MSDDLKEMRKKFSPSEKQKQIRQRLDNGEDIRVLKEEMQESTQEVLQAMVELQEEGNQAPNGKAIMEKTSLEEESALRSMVALDYYGVVRMFPDEFYEENKDQIEGDTVVQTEVSHPEFAEATLENMRDMGALNEERVKEKANEIFNHIQGNSSYSNIEHFIIGKIISQMSEKALIQDAQVSEEPTERTEKFVEEFDPEEHLDQNWIMRVIDE